MKLKWLHFADVAETQEAVTDELKKAQKGEFLAAFRKLYDRAKACVYANGAYLDTKSYVSSSCVFDLKKKISPETLDRTVYRALKTRQKVMENVHFARPLFSRNA